MNSKETNQKQKSEIGNKIRDQFEELVAENAELKARAEARDNSFSKGTHRVCHTNETLAPSFNNENSGCPCSNVTTQEDGDKDQTMEEQFAKM